VNLHTLEWKLNRLLQKFAFGSIRDVMQTRRVQLSLRRDPVYIPSNLGPEWGGGEAGDPEAAEAARTAGEAEAAEAARAAIRERERREAHDARDSQGAVRISPA
jgi:hypothetical protein